MDKKTKEFAGVQLNSFTKRPLDNATKSTVDPQRMFDNVSKQVVNNKDLAYRVNIFEIIEGDYDTIVRFYSPRLYIFSYKNYGISFLTTESMKRNLYKQIILALKMNEDLNRFTKDDLASLNNIKDTYFNENSSHDAFVLGKELLKSIFNSTKERILAK